MADTSIDARKHFTKEECELLESFLDNKDAINSLKKENETLTKKIKEMMNNKGLSSFDLDFTHFNLTDSKRKQVKRGKKDVLIETIIKLNKKHLLVQTTEPDLDSIFDELDAGMFPKSVFDECITVSDVQVLTTKDKD